MIEPVDNPSKEAHNRDIAALEDPVTDTQTRHGTGVLVVVVLRVFPTDNSGDVFGQNLSLAHGVLGVWHTVATDTATAEVGDAGNIASRPHSLENFGIVGDTKVCLRTDAFPIIQRNSGATEHGLGFHAGRPHHNVGFEDHSVRELETPADCALQLGVEVDVCLTLGKVLDNPQAALERHLGHDAIHGLDEVEMSVIDAERRKFPQHRGHQATQLRKCFNTGKPSADNNNRQQAIARWARRHIGCNVKVVDDTVTYRNSFFNGLHTDSRIGNTGNGESPRHSTCGDHDVVIVQGEISAAFGSDGDLLLAVINASDAGGNHASFGQVTTQRNNRVTRLNRTRSHLRQEGLVSHVGQRVNHRYFGLTPPQQLFELERRIETGITATHNDNFGHNTPIFTCKTASNLPLPERQKYPTCTDHQHQCQHRGKAPRHEVRQHLAIALGHHHTDDWLLRLVHHSRGRPQGHDCRFAVALSVQGNPRL